MKKISKKKVCFLLCLVYVFQLLFNLSTVKVFAAPTIIDLSVNKSSAASGDQFTYTIKYASPSTSEDSVNAVIKDVLPSEVSYVSCEPASNATVSTAVDQTSGRTVVTITFNDTVNGGLKGLKSGSSGVIKLTAMFPNGTTQSGTVATNTATFYDDTHQSGSNSQPVNVTSTLNSPNWSLTKTKLIPSGSTSPALDQPVTYGINLVGNSGIGQLNLQNAVIVDTLPANSEYVSSSNSGTYDSTANTVTWNVGTVSVGTTVSRQIVIKYPSSKFIEGTVVTNNAEATAQLLGSSISLSKTASADSTISAASATVSTFTKTGRQSNDEYSLGQTAQFYIGNIKNTGNVPLDNFIIEDDIPKEINLTSVTTGKFNNDVVDHVRYKTNKSNSSWLEWTNSPIINPNNSKLLVSDLSLAADEYVTAVQWDLGQAAAGFANTSNIGVTGDIINPDHEGGSVAVGSKITNTAKLSWSYNNTPSSENASVTVNIAAPQPWLSPSKSASVSSLLPGADVEYTLTLKNNDFATGDYINPDAYDVLPDSLTFDSYSGWDKGNSSIASAPVFTQSTNSGKVLLKWAWSDGSTLKPGQYITIKFKATVKNNTAAGPIKNSFYMDAGSNTFRASNSVTDTTDINGNGSSTDTLAEADNSIFVRFTGSLTSEEYVKGHLDSVWSKYPASGSTLPGGTADYKLVISTNNANAAINNIKIINILPNKGDTGVIDTSPRDSEWRPYLVNTITGWNETTDSTVGLPSGVKVYYSTSSSPSTDELSDTVNGIADSSWSETPPADITTVKSIKFDCSGYNNGNGLNPNDKIVLHWSMRAPVGAPYNANAWDSYGVGATYPDMGSDASQTVQSSFLPTEPIKVGFNVAADPDAVYNLGNYVWEDKNKNGIKDSNETGINNVLVNLYDSSGTTLLAYTRTGYDQNGNPGYYNFPDLPGGTYKLEFIPPSGQGYYVTAQGFDSKAVSGTTSDSTYCGVISNIALGANDTAEDAGFYRKCSIGDLIWNDIDDDGIKDSNEAGLNNVTVDLYNADTNSKITSTTTDSNGKYSFAGLDPGNYYIQAEKPNNNYVFSSAKLTGDNKNNADSTGKTATISLNSNDSISSADIGLHKASVGDYFWEDKNANGIKDSGDGGISGATVTLCDENGNAIPGKTTTTISGYYSFTDLDAGSYKVKFTLPSGYAKFSPQSVGSDQTNDSNADNNGLSDAVTLTAGQIDNSIDAGAYKYASIGDFVWEDTNGNGKQDSGEKGISGVKVNLLDGSGNQVNDGSGNPITATTNSSGKYYFTNLVPGSYYIEVIAPASMYFTTQNASGTTTANRSVINVSTGKSTAVTLTSGLNIITFDAGLYKYASLGDFVWDDANGNGLQDSGESGIGNVPVSLYKSGSSTAVSTTATASDGSYSFQNLVPGSYYVKFGLPAGYDKFTVSNSSDVNKNSDADASGKTTVFPLSSGQNKTDIDAGVNNYGSVSGIAFEDSNGNGIKDESEAVLSNITVKLKDQSGNVLQSTTTGSLGTYSFSNLVPGTAYTIQMTKPSGYSITTQGLGTAQNTGSDIDKGTGTAATFTLTSGESDRHFNGGFYKLGSIGDYVWEDTNGNGIQDTLEAPVSGVTVKLLNNGSVAATITTDNSGKYLFSNLEPGSYSIEFTAPNGYVFTSQNIGNNSAVDSDVSASTDTTAAINLGYEENNMTIDAGLYKPVSIGDTVWEDKNANGIQDSGELGIPNVTVQLLDSNSSLIASTATDSNGKYLFNSLAPGSYSIKVICPAGMHITTEHTASAATDSDIDPATGQSEAITLTSGEADLDLDAGLYTPASLGDYVWEDSNNNGIQDTGENGVAGVSVSLYKQDNTLVKTTATAANGSYSFANLTPGSYYVKFTLPGGFDQFSINNSSDAAKNSDADSSGKTPAITLISGQNDNTIDVGIYKYCSVSGITFDDTDGNGIKCSTEAVIPNVTVKLEDENGGIIKTAVSDASGAYSFDGLIPAKVYKIEMSKPSGYSITAENQGTAPYINSNIDKATGITAAFTLDSGEADKTFNGGFYKLGSIGDYVWEDTNGNGVKDSNEPAVSGITVKLHNNNTVIATATTDAYGKYLFSNLEPGNYTVEFVLPNGYQFTAKNAGGNPNTDSDVSTSAKATDNIALGYEQNNLSVDAGIYKPIAIGDYVWKDLNNNGIQDAGEPSLDGVTVNLYNSADNSLTSSTVTQNGGLYSFAGLKPGNYYIQFAKPDGYIFTKQIKGTDTSKDSNCSSDGKYNFSLNSGIDDLTIDAGVNKLCNLTINVINSNTKENITDAAIKLYDSQGSLVYSGTSDENGLFTVSNIIGDSNYSIVISKTNYDVYNGSVSIAEQDITKVCPLTKAADYTPVVPDYTKSTPENTPYSSNIKGSENNSNYSLTYSVSSAPQNGSVVLNSDGSYTYTPGKNFIGVDTFNVMVYDGNGGAAFSTVTVNVIRNPVDLIGTATDEKTGSVLPNTKISLYDGTNKLIASAVTDSTGNYIIKNITLGNYSFIAENSKYNTKTIEVHVWPVNPTDTTVRQDVKLVNFKIELTANPSTIVGDGKSTSLLTAVVKDKDGSPVANVTVTFSAPDGTFPNGYTAVTDSTGKASVLYKSSEIEDINPVVIPVTATVDDTVRGLHSSAQILITFEPGKIVGAVIDNSTGLPVKGAIVRVSKDFDGDGIVDFYSEMVTGEDGKYSIAIPKGNTKYDLYITKPVTVNGYSKEKTFHQTASAGELTGQGESYYSDKTASGLILIKQPDGTPKEAFDYSKYGIAVYSSDDQTHPLTGITAFVDSNGIYDVQGLDKNKSYILYIFYTTETGEKLIVGSCHVTVTDNGQINLDTILIDPYGTVSDSVTGAKISGADITLYYADTANNRAKGIIPGTKVNLPIIDGFAPSNNANPQYSDSNGKFAFMVMPNTDYYIVAVKDGYYTFTSGVISVGNDLVNYNFKMTPIKTDKPSISNSSYSNLPKTGTLIEKNDLIILGTIFIIIGSILMLAFRKNKEY